MNTFAYQVIREQGFLDFLANHRHVSGLVMVVDYMTTEIENNGPYPSRNLSRPGHVAFIYPVNRIPGLPRIEAVCRIQDRTICLLGARLS